MYFAIKLPHNPIINVNEGFVRITGFSRQEILGSNCRFLPGQAIHLQAIDKIRQAVHKQHELIIGLLDCRKGNMLGLKDIHVMVHEHLDLRIVRLLKYVYQQGLEFSGKPAMTMMRRAG